MQICKGCEFYSENKKKAGWVTLRLDEHCTDCGCTLSAKTKCLSCQCPKDHWFPVASEEDHEQIKLYVNGK